MAIYLDHGASSPLRPEAADAIRRGLELTGNPSSVHGHGQAALRALEDAREGIARNLGCDPIEVVLTSGGTESANLAILGAFEARQKPVARPRIVSPLIEHHATLDPIAHLQATRGATLTPVLVNHDGVVDVAALREALGDGEDVALVAVSLVNAEVGTVQPVREIVEAARAVSVPVFVDAVAALGHIPVSAREIGVDLLAVSAHKIGGPVGAGALVVARGATLSPQMHGGGHQRGLRSGTMDVLSASAFAAAAHAACEPEALALEQRRLQELSMRLIEGLEQIDGVTLRGPRPDAVLVDAGVKVPARSPGSVHVTVDGCQGDSLLLMLDMAGISVSTGSACRAGVQEPSHVLMAMGLSEKEALGALRMTLGWNSTEADIDALLQALPPAIERARAAGLS